MRQREGQVGRGLNLLCVMGTNDPTSLGGDCEMFEVVMFSETLQALILCDVLTSTLTEHRHML